MLVKEIIRHPMYDAALMRLKGRLTFGPSIQSVALMNVGDKINEGAFCLTSGWGRTGEEEQGSNRLKAVELPYIGHKHCDKIYTNKGGIDKSEICAGFDRGGADSCSGDSGGPLVYPSKGAIKKRKLIGIVSNGYGCARAGLPGKYVDISIILKWINEVARV